MFLSRWPLWPWFSSLLGGIYVRKVLAASDTSWWFLLSQNTHIARMRWVLDQLYKRSEKSAQNDAKVEDEDEMIGEFLEISRIQCHLIWLRHLKTSVQNIHTYLETLEAKLLFKTTRKFRWWSLEFRKTRNLFILLIRLNSQIHKHRKMEKNVVVKSRFRDISKEKCFALIEWTWF